MPIYKEDLHVINGKKVGETVSGDEIRLPYSTDGVNVFSMTVDGVTYRFDRMDGNELVYKKVSPQVAESLGLTVDSSQVIARDALPAGAILDRGFIGRYLVSKGKRYRLMQPITKCGEEYVYVEVAEKESGN